MRLPRSFRGGRTLRASETAGRAVELAQAGLAALQPPAILLGPGFEHLLAMRAERELGMLRPVRIEQRLAPDRHQIGAALRQKVLGLLRMQDQADRDGGDPGGLSDLSRVGHLKTVAARNPRGYGFQ